MTKNNPTLTPDDYENYIQRFMQIRDQVNAEIAKIGAHVATLEATNKRLVAHFDVFEEMSKKSREKIYSAIKASSQDLTRESVKTFSPLIEELLRKQILELDQSVATANRVLTSAMQMKEAWPLQYVLLFWSFLVVVGFGLGSIFSQPHITPLPEDFRKVYDLGKTYQYKQFLKEQEEKGKGKGKKASSKKGR